MQRSLQGDGQKTAALAGQVMMSFVNFCHRFKNNMCTTFVLMIWNMNGLPFQHLHERRKLIDASLLLEDFGSFVGVQGPAQAQRMGMCRWHWSLLGAV